MQTHATAGAWPLSASIGPSGRKPHGGCSGHVRGDILCGVRQGCPSTSPSLRRHLHLSLIFRIARTMVKAVVLGAAGEHICSHSFARGCAQSASIRRHWPALVPSPQDQPSHHRGSNHASYMCAPCTNAPSLQLSLYDIVNTPGVAADLSHISTPAKVVGYLPPDDGLKKALTGAEIVIIPAGVPRKPGVRVYSL